MAYENFGLIVIGLIMIVTGMNEVWRLVLFSRYKKITFHNINLNELERVKIRQGEEAKNKLEHEMRKDWWKHQGRESLFYATTATLGGFVVIYLAIRAN